MKKENKEEILNAIKKIIGDTKFEFSEDYINHIGGLPTIGEEACQYNGITKDYLHITCAVTYEENEQGEKGVCFHKYSIKQKGWKDVSKVKLDELFTKDLNKLYEDIKYFLWWENNHFKWLEKKYIEAQKYSNLYQKYFLT